MLQSCDVTTIAYGNENNNICIYSFSPKTSSITNNLLTLSLVICGALCLLLYIHRIKTK